MRGIHHITSIHVVLPPRNRSGEAIANKRSDNEDGHKQIPRLLLLRPAAARLPLPALQLLPPLLLPRAGRRWLAGLLAGLSLVRPYRRGWLTSTMSCRRGATQRDGGKRRRLRAAAAALLRTCVALPPPVRPERSCQHAQSPASRFWAARWWCKGGPCCRCKVEAGHCAG